MKNLKGSSTSGWNKSILDRNRISQKKILINKKEKIQLNKIRNERGDITTSLTEIKMIIGEYSKQLSAKMLYNWEKMDKFLQLLNLTQEEIKNLNRYISKMT